MHFTLLAWNQQNSNRILTTAITITWQHEKLQFSPVKTWCAIAPVSRVWQQDELEEELVEILLSFSFNCLGNFCKRLKIRTVCKEELYLELKLKPVDKALLWTKIKKSRIFDFGKKPRVPSSGAAIPKYFLKKVYHDFQQLIRSPICHNFLKSTLSSNISWQKIEYSEYCQLLPKYVRPFCEGSAAVWKPRLLLAYWPLQHVSWNSSLICQG